MRVEQHTSTMGAEYSSGLPDLSGSTTRARSLCGTLSHPQDPPAFFSPPPKHRTIVSAIKTATKKRPELFLSSLETPSETYVVDFTSKPYRILGRWTYLHERGGGEPRVRFMVKLAIIFSFPNTLIAPTWMHCMAWHGFGLRSSPVRIFP